MKLKSFLIVISLFLLITITAALILLNQNNKKENEVCFKNNCFKVELAQNLEERNLGLMFRENMDSDKGMLFIFDEEGEYPFWMKNTLIPLDIIWMDENKEIVFINENFQPCKEDPCPTINPNQNAKYVLEINAGISKEIDLNIGDKVGF